MTRMADDPIRKAAVLIASLDPDSADALLQHMAPDQEARVRAAVMQLDDVDASEQQQVIQEFVNRSPHPAPTAIDDGGVELDVSLAQQLADEPALCPDRDDHAAQAAAPFQSLQHVDAPTLANLLIREHPQTISIVLSHVAADRAAQVLAELPRHLQTEVLMRIARLADPAPEILEDIESQMQSMLAHCTSVTPFGPAGLATVQAILHATHTQQRRQFVEGLAAQDQQLLTQLRQATADAGDWLPANEPLPQRPDPLAGSDPQQPASCAPRAGQAPDDPPSRAPQPSPSPAPPLAFADLEQLDDSILALVLQQAEPHTTLLALAGASSGFVQRIMRHLPAREAQQLEQRMRQLGPIRLDDIERAQEQLAAVAQHLLHARQPPPNKERFTVAA